MDKMLKKLESKSIFIVREAKAQFKRPAVLWSTGKDSTSTLWIIKKAFWGEIPFPVIHIDTTYEFPQIYEFRDKLVKEWNLNLIVAKNENALKRGISPETTSRFNCCSTLKTEALKKIIEKHKFDALFISIRWDEQGIRGKERFFSPRDKDFKWLYLGQEPEFFDLYPSSFKGASHIRIHPLLHWKESDVWKYIKQERIPVNPLYFSRNGKRYRSLGCIPCTVPIDSEAKTIDEIIEETKRSKILGEERNGRTQDKEGEYVMLRLRALGYF
jgi:sulfate adenylyltransferase subunit 2